MTSPTRNEYISLLHAFALGSLNREDYVNLIHFLSEEDDFPWQELGEFQNLAALLPSFLDLESPEPELKKRMARKISSIRGSDRLIVKKERLDIPAMVQKPKQVEERELVVEEKLSSPSNGKSKHKEEAPFVPKEEEEKPAPKIVSVKPKLETEIEEEIPQSPFLTDRRKRIQDTGVRNRNNLNPRDVPPARKSPAPFSSPENDEDYTPKRPVKREIEEEETITRFGKPHKQEEQPPSSKRKNKFVDEDEDYRQEPPPNNRKEVTRGRLNQEEAKPVNLQRPKEGNVEESFTPEPFLPEWKNEQVAEVDPLKTKSKRVVVDRPKYQEEEPPVSSVPYGRSNDVQLPNNEVAPQQPMPPAQNSPVAQPAPYYPQAPQQFQPAPVLPPAENKVQEPQKVFVDDSSKPFYKRSVKGGVFWSIILMVIAIITLIFFMMVKEIEKINIKINDKVALVTADLNYLQELKKSGKMNESVLGMIVFSHDLRVVPLQGQGDDYKQSFGKVLIDQKTGKLLIQYTNLFSFTPETGYQLWIKTGQTFTAIGKVINPVRSFNFYEVSDIQFLKESGVYDILVTREPMSGSKVPSTEVIMIGRADLLQQQTQTMLP